MAYNDISVVMDVVAAVKIDTAAVQEEEEVEEDNAIILDGFVVLDTTAFG